MITQVGVVGLGYVGLPLTRALVNAGLSVLGIDVDERKVQLLNSGESYIKSLSSDEVGTMVSNGKFRATADFSESRTCQAILICVPTPLGKNREPDLSYVVNTAESLAPHLVSGQLFVLESTTYPGTTKEVLEPIFSDGKHRRGTDYFLAYSPEREDPGNAQFSTDLIPKVVGADDQASLDCAVALYERIVPQVIPVSTAATAEAVKLTENIFRSVNIALVNELKVVYDAMGIDIWEVIDAAKTKPFGFMPFYPGPGLGGHCIPIDPFYLTWKAREYDISTRFIELAGEVNTSMPSYVVSKLQEAVDQRLGKGLSKTRVLIVGVAYKKNVDDPRESPAFVLMEQLQRRGAVISYYDPFIPALPKMREHPSFQGWKSISWDKESLREFDAAVIVTDHDQVDYSLLGENSIVVVDTRNALRSADWAQKGGKSSVVKA